MFVIDLVLDAVSFAGVQLFRIRRAWRRVLSSKRGQ
jgi:hypothetical protein